MNFLSLDCEPSELFSIVNLTILVFKFVYIVVTSGEKRIQDEIVIATKFAAYPWRLTPGQFVQACRFAFYCFYSTDPLYLTIDCPNDD